MIHVIQTIENQEYWLGDARFDEKTGLWIGEVLDKKVRVGVSSRLVRIVFFFDSDTAWANYQADQAREGRSSKTRGGDRLIH